MKVSKKTIILSVLLCLLPSLLGVIWWDKLPEQIPTHFDLNNQPDRYSSKAFAVFGLPLLLAGLDLLCIWGTGMDPRREKQSEVLQIICLFIPGAIGCIIAPTAYLAAMGKSVDIAMIICLFSGVLFMIVGNYLPKCRRNYTIGIKLPWTLEDDDNWNFTHRLGGVCFMLGGLLSLISALLNVPGLLFISMGTAVLIPVIGSYLYYKKHKGGEAQ